MRQAIVIAAIVLATLGAYVSAQAPPPDLTYAWLQTRVRPLAPQVIGPATGSTNVASVPVLAWLATGAANADIYLGTSTSPPLLKAGVVGSAYTPATALQPLTRYYWKVVARNAAGTVTGSTWTFTTGNSGGGLVVFVHVGQNLQAAISAAAPGTTLVLDQAGVYRGNFTLPAKAGASATARVTIASAGMVPTHSPAPWVLPSDAPLMAVLETPNTMAAVATDAGAAFYTLRLLEIRNATSPNYGTVLCGDGSAAQTTLAQVPHDIMFDSVYVHDTASGGGKRGIALNCASATISNSYISGFRVQGQDSQAVSGWNGPGPFALVNSYFEAASENVMFGGSDPAIPNLVPSDILVRGDYFAKPLAWQGGGWAVKNLFELKNAQRVTVENSVFEHNWADGQPGSGILATVRNQDGACPWCTVRDVTFQYDVVKDVALYAFNILGLDDRPGIASVRCANLRIANVLVLSTYSGLQLNTPCSPTEVAHVSMPDLRYRIATLLGAKDQQLNLHDNVFSGTDYGIFGDNDGLGVNALNTYAPGTYAMTKNVIEAGPSNISWPPGQYLLDAGTLAAKLDSQKRYTGGEPSTDGAVLGSDIDAIKARIPWLTIP